MAATLFERLLAGEEAALARAVSVLESGQPKALELARALRQRAGGAAVIGITGPPGAGKSTLIDAYITHLRESGVRVAVLAVDPSSPLSGGAVLGDRARMGRHVADPGVFIRSIASRGHLGGLSSSLPASLDAVDAAGWPVIVLETVGAGQSEVEVVDFADVRIVVNAPGLGDDVQAIKTGILEIADILVVNKADTPLAERTVRQMTAMLKLRRAERQDVPIVKTVATAGEGVAELHRHIEALADAAAAEGRGQRLQRRIARQLLETLAAEVVEMCRSGQAAELTELSEQVQAGEIDMDAATRQLLASLSAQL